MRIENSQLRDFINDSEMVKKEDLEAAFKEAQNKEKKLGEILLEKKLIDEVKLRKLYAYILGVPFVDLVKEIIDQDILQIIPEPIAKKYKIIADLSIKGITKEIIFEVFIVVKNEFIYAEAELEIDRTEFGIRYASKKFFKKIANAAIADTFKLKVSLAGRKQ